MMFGLISRKHVRKTSRRISKFLWRVSGPCLLVAGAVVMCWGFGSLALYYGQKSGRIPGDTRTATSRLVVGLAAIGLGFSIRKMYRERQGIIDSVALKEKQKNG